MVPAAVDAGDRGMRDLAEREGGAAVQRSRAARAARAARARRLSLRC